MFEAFPKISRLYRDIVVTEKLDGTNAQVYIAAMNVADDKLENWPNLIAHKDIVGGKLMMFAASRNRFIRPEKDNFGFASWVQANSEILWELGPGRHFGEWWGEGIQRGYGLSEKRFSLFNVTRWSDDRPVCCHVVPVLYEGPMDTATIRATATLLSSEGSAAAPGFMQPEGVVVYHPHSNTLFKHTIDDDGHKG